MDREGAWQRVADARVARLATIGPDGRPDLVPVTYALLGSLAQGGRLVTAVDHKPKSTRRLARLDNVRARPDVSLLVDRYDDDWTQLWWVRLHGLGRVVDGPPTGEELAALAGRYPPYRDTPPAGPVIDIEITAWQWWSSAPDQDDAATVPITPTTPASLPEDHAP
jgi:PPOX class probable F420-dependent enzyme